VRAHSVIGAAAVAVASLVFAGCATASSATSASMTAQMDGASATAGALTITKAYIPQPPSPDVAALYFTAHNTGTTAITLTGVSTDAAGSAGFHHYVVEAGGGEQMTALDTITIPAHGTVQLVPGYDHVMLEQPKALTKGSTATVTISVAGAPSVTLHVPVVAITGLEATMPGM
jgi:copper(I)-binding protein